MKRGFQWLLAMAMSCSALLATAQDAPGTDWRAPLTEENAVYDDFEQAFKYAWTWSKTANWVAMPATDTSKWGLLTTAGSSKPGKEYLPFVGNTAEATVSAWTVSMYGVLSCREDAGVWSFGKPGVTANTEFHLGLVRRAGNVLQVVHGNPGGTKANPVAPRVLCQATVEGLDTDSRLYTVVSDGTSVRLFVDGAEVAAATPADANDLKAYASWQVGAFTGSEPSYAGLAFADGMLLDAVALQGRALTDAEILGLAQHVFPRAQGVNVAVPAVLLPESWKADAPAFVRVRTAGADVSAYRRLRKPDATDDWYASALTGAEGGDILGPCPDNGKPSALFALGGTVNRLVGGKLVPQGKVETYNGDTLVVVGDTTAKQIAGGMAMTSSTWSSKADGTFNGNSKVLVQGELASGTTVVGGCYALGSTDGELFKHNGDSTVEVSIPEAEATFAATIIGGSFDTLQRSYRESTAMGVASVTIDAPNVTFSSTIVAGNYGEGVKRSGMAMLTLKAGHFMGSLLPFAEGAAAPAASTLAIEGDIDLSRATLGIFDMLTLAGKLTLGEKRLASTTLATPTVAATLALSLTEAERAAGADITLCKVAFDALPDALTVTVAEAPAGWEARVTPDRLLVYGPSPVDHVWAGGDTVWGEAFPEWKAGEVATFEPPAENATRTITLGENVAAERVILKGSNRLVGTGSLVAAGVTLEDGATLALPKEAVGAFKWVRLTLGAGQNASATQVALAEFMLTQGGEPVLWPLGTTIARGDGSKPAWNNNEQLNALIDGIYKGSAASKAINPEDGSEKAYVSNKDWNKWFVTKDNNNTVAVIALGEPVEADGYTLRTGDTANRTPAAWTLEVSDDGVAWRPFDARSGVSGSAAHTAYDYLARGEARVETDTLILGEGVAFDLSQGFAPLVAGVVRGTGGTVVLPTGGISSRVPFLVTPVTGLTFTIKDDPETRYRVVYADGAYCVEPYTLTMPLSATVTQNAVWTALPWKDAAGYDVPVRFWADASFVPDVGLTFTKTATVTVAAYTLNTLTIHATTGYGNLNGTKDAKLSMSTLDLQGSLFANAIAPTGTIKVAAGKTFVADIGSAMGDTTWNCAMEGEGTFVKRGSNVLDIKGPITLPTIIHGWNRGSRLVLNHDYTGAIFFSVAKANANALSTTGANGGGTVTIAEGATLTLTESDISKGSSQTNNAVFAGRGALAFAEGATLSLSDTYFDASGVEGGVTFAGAAKVAVADPSVGRLLLKCAAPEAEQAARLLVEGDWFAQAVDGTGYVLAALPMPAEGHGLEGEALRAVRAAAASAGLPDGFAVQALTSAGKEVASPADALACFTGLPLEASVEHGVTVRCDFGIAALRSVENGAALLLKAQILNGAFAEGTELNVMGNVDLSDVSLVAPPDGEVEEPGVRWFRVPFVENLGQLTIRASRNAEVIP